MADLNIIAGQIRPLNGAIVRRFVAGATLSVGDAVYVAANGTVQPADANTQDSAQARGIVVAVGVTGATSASTGQAVDVVTHGAIAAGVGELTPGGAVFVSAANAGKLDQSAPASAGDFPFSIGWAASSSVLYVQPQTTVPTANS